MAERTPESDDEPMAQLRQEFLEDAKDGLDVVQGALEQIYADGGDNGKMIDAIRREVHSLKGMGNSFGFPTISLTAHRLEDYLADATQLTRERVADVEVFLDFMREIVVARADPGLGNAGALIRALPIAAGTDLDNIEMRDAEVLLVAPSRLVRGMVAEELAACGYRVTRSDAPWEAFKLAACTKPDLILTSVVMDHVGGIDLARAFAAMATTADIPVAVLTSFPRTHPELRRLPPGTGIIRLGAHLSEDLCAIIAELEAMPLPEPKLPADFLRPLKILLADDKHANRLFAQVMLQKEGHGLVAVGSGREAVKALREDRFDLVLMDVRMPELDGLEATRLIRALPGDISRVPIIALTAGDTDADVAECLEAGMNELVSKPIDKAQLIDAIARWAGTGGSPGVAADPGAGASTTGGSPSEASRRLEDLVALVDTTSKQIVEATKERVSSEEDAESRSDACGPAQPPVRAETWPNPTPRGHRLGRE